MIVKDLNGLPVSLVRSDGKSLYDRNGTKYRRNPQHDDPDHAGYSSDTTTVLLDRAHLRRVVSGSMAVSMTVEELRDFCTVLPEPEEREVVNAMSDQTLRGILIECEESGKNPELVLVRKARSLIPKKTITEALPKATEKPRVPYPSPNTPKARKREGSIVLDLGDVSVSLTPKQIEFMERLSECPGWDGKPTGEYNAQEYAQELSDTMNPMSVGAVLTTLREKHMLTTEKKRVGAIKCCIFQLTDLGVRVYNKLAGKEK